MRRVACLLVALGCVLLALTVVGVSRPDRAPARVVRPVGARHVPTALQRAMNRFLHSIGGGQNIVRHRLPRVKTITVPHSPGQTCAVSAVVCSLHPCLLYTGQTRPTVLRLDSVVRNRGRPPGPAATALARAARVPASRSCRRPRPAFASARVAG